MKALYPKKKQVAASCVALVLDRANLLAPISPAVGWLTQSKGIAAGSSKHDDASHLYY
jgi:hypothetical protein